MKTEREFIDGIYEKTTLYEIKRKKQRILKKGIILSSIAAVMVFVIIQTTSINGQMYVPIELDIVNVPSIARYAAIPDIDSMISCDSIVIAKVANIKKSEYKDGYLITKVIVNVIDTLKGNADKKIEITVNGGYDDKTKLYEQYEAMFKTNEQVLLFLTDENYLQYGSLGKYTKVNDDVYSNKEQEIDIAELRVLLSK